jgi:hypothetical protein
MHRTRIIHSLVIATLATGIIAIAPSLVLADNMSSSSYQLYFGNFNMTSGTKTSTSYGLTDTVGQTAPGQFGQAGYVVKSGFQYLYPFTTFSFKISPQRISFGSLSLNTLTTASQYLEVTAVGAGGYSVKVSEDHPMRATNGSGNTIADTLCNTTCSETTAGVWTSTSKYGFGYNMAGDDAVSGFTNSTYFKQFADLSAAETPQTIMTSTSVGTKRHGVLTYQINIGASQPTGDYQTAITYTAIPGY